MKAFVDFSHFVDLECFGIKIEIIIQSHDQHSSWDRLLLCRMNMFADGCWQSWMYEYIYKLCTFECVTNSIHMQYTQICECMQFLHMMWMYEYTSRSCTSHSHKTPNGCPTDQIATTRIRRKYARAGKSSRCICLSPAAYRSYLWW